MKRTFFSALLAGALMLPGAGTALAQDTDSSGREHKPPKSAAQLNAGKHRADVALPPFYKPRLGLGYDPHFYGWSNGAYFYPYGVPVTGGVRLQVKPKTAQVFVDGTYAGVIGKFDGFFQQLDLLPGGHTIEIRAPGFETLTFTTHPRLNHTIDYKAVLIPSSAVEQ